jgi:hypothetical protein
MAAVATEAAAMEAVVPGTEAAVAGTEAGTMAEITTVRGGQPLSASG